LLSLQELIDCVHKQKVGKATGPDDIAMEAIINGGPKLAIHLCILFNLFPQYSCLLVLCSVRITCKPEYAGPPHFSWGPPYL